MKLEGTVSDLTGKCPDLSFFVDGTHVVADRSTDYKKGKCGDVRNGRKVKVTGVKTNNVVQATTIEID
jgi:hypothetical protein